MKVMIFIYYFLFMARLAASKFNTYTETLLISNGTEKLFLLSDETCKFKIDQQFTYLNWYNVRVTLLSTENTGLQIAQDSET